MTPTPTSSPVHGRSFPEVDVATGRVALTETDPGVSGLLAQALSRTHVSSWRHGQWFGARWASCLDERLVAGEHRDGRLRTPEQYGRYMGGGARPSTFSPDGIEALW